MAIPRVASFLAAWVGLSICCSQVLATETSYSGTPYTESRDTHQVRLLDEGASALKQRLDMIHRARHTIDIDTWTFNTTHAPRLILQALVDKKKADPQIEIRIIVDYYADGTLAQLNPEIAAKLAEKGVQLRYYNQISKLHFLELDHRDHRKLFIVDGRAGDRGNQPGEAIIGSRNLSDDHFNLGDGFNYVDHDVWIQGSIVQAMEESFSDYWNSSAVKTPVGEFGRTWPDDVITQNKVDQALLEKVEQVGGQELCASKVFEVNHVSFVTDGFANAGNFDRLVTPYVDKTLTQIQASLIAENWAFIPSFERRQIFSNLLRRGVQVHLLTNGYHATTVSGLAWVQSAWTLGHGLRMYLYGAPPDEARLDGKPSSGTFETHAKIDVRDHQFTDIGSYNWDGRSESLNHEDLLTVDSPEFAAVVIHSMHERILKSDHLNSNGKTDSGKSYFGNITGLKLEERKALLDVESVLSEQY